MSTSCSCSDVQWRYFTFFTFRRYANRVSLFSSSVTWQKYICRHLLSYFVLAFARDDQIRKFDRRRRHYDESRWVVVPVVVVVVVGSSCIRCILYTFRRRIDRTRVDTAQIFVVFGGVFSIKSRIIEKNTLRCLWSCFYFFRLRVVALHGSLSLFFDHTFCVCRKSK